MMLRGIALVNKSISLTCISTFFLCLLRFTTLPHLYSETLKMHLLCDLLHFLRSVSLFLNLSVMMYVATVGSI